MTGQDGQHGQDSGTEIPVRPVAAADVPEVSACLARSFEGDPVSRYLFPGSRTHLRRLERYFRWQFNQLFIPRGEAWTTDDLAGASLWVPPRRRSAAVTEAAGQLVTVVRILGFQTGRALRLLDELEAVHPKTMHCYLGPIGTEPSRQGTGIGSALMTVVLDRLDEEEMPAYLESSKEENLAFFHRHGFEVTGEIKPSRAGSPRLWLMWREPRPPGPSSSPDAGSTGLRPAHPANRPPSDEPPPQAV